LQIAGTSPPASFLAVAEKVTGSDALLQSTMMFVGQLITGAVKAVAAANIDSTSK
jgi:hypothetical protein